MNTLSLTLQAPPSVWAVYRAQLLSTRSSVRPIAIVIFGLLMIGPGLAGIMDRTFTAFMPTSSFLLVATLWPLSVWRDEDPTRRSYHWGMPVSRFWHAIFKVCAGWTWLLVGIAVCVLVIALAITLFSPRDSIGAVRLAELRLIEWVLLFTGPSIIYLMMSAIIIVSSHPWRWISGTALAYIVVSTILIARGSIDAFVRLSYILSGKYGFGMATGGIGYSIETTALEMPAEMPVELAALKVDALTFGALPNVRAAALWFVISMFVVVAAALWRAKYPPRRT